MSLSKRKAQFKLEILYFPEFLGRETLLKVKRSSWELTGAQKNLFWVYISDFSSLVCRRVA